MQNTEYLSQKMPIELLNIVTELQQKLQEKIELEKNYQTKITYLELRIAQLLQERYAKRSEKFDPKQLSLFDEPTITEAELERVETQEETLQVASFTRKKTGRKPLPAHFISEEIIHDLAEADKYCSCGCALTEIGADKSEQLDIVPAQFKKLIHIRKKYACKVCEDTIKTAALPAQPIPKSIAAPGLLAHVLVSKYADHLPLYRQENILQRIGVDIPRASMSAWMIRCAHLLKPLVTLMQAMIQQGDVAYADETTIQVLKEKGRLAETDSYMWYFAGGPAPQKRCIVYEYHASRAGKIARDFFGTYAGYLHCDGYAGYDAMFVTQKIIGVGCWAHSRRKFAAIVKSQKNNPGFALEAINILKKVYHLEKIAKEESYTLEQIQAMREEKARPILLNFKERLEHKLLLAPPSSAIAAAIKYTLNQWRKLMGYLKDPRLEIDNNASERAMKDFAIGRKNWMFSNSTDGAEASAIIYSLMQTCKIHLVEPYAYFKSVLAALPTATTEDLESLLPFNFAKKL